MRNQGQGSMSDTVASSHVGLGGSEAEKNWFAVFTVPRHEKRVEEHFRLREIESCLPLYRTQRRWKDGSRGVLDLPLFSNYIFVRIDHGGRVPVLKVPGVISIVGWGPQPLSVSDSYIRWLREGLRQGKIEPHPHLTIGTRVRIHSGAMAGMEGVLIRKKNNFRVVLTLEMIMKSVTVEVEIEDIEPVGRISCGSVLQVAASA
jgi:transcription antitermination factor NusG